jgi:hypothetical protein
MECEMQKASTEETFHFEIEKGGKNGMEPY